jgi:purine-binding chemotaxis protein CheW
MRRALARGGGAVSEYLAFRLRGETFALPLGDVREILVPPPITLVPRAARDVLGIVSVRGRLVTVIELATRMGLDRHSDVPSVATKRERVLLVESQAQETMGLRVDEVLSVYRLGEAEIEPSAALGGSVAEHVAGIGRRDGELLVLLDLAVLLRGRTP